MRPPVTGPVTVRIEEPSPAPRTLLHLIRSCDAISLWSGRVTGWLIFPMVLSLVYEVVARYLFNAPTTWAYDMTYMLYGAFFMLGAAYTLLRQRHIRTDVLYGKWSVRWQGLVDAVCYLIFFFPPLIALLWVSADFFWISLQRGERVVSSPWMPVVYPLKLVIPVTCLLLTVQGIGEFLRSIYAARSGIWIARCAAAVEPKEFT
jgi:TRAP-type mannitol/chloroaromatic compound transport system permease small subunit